jgi:Fe-S-cluster containining protein
MNRIPSVQIRREELKRGENICSYCTAKCCRYFSLSIDTPKTRQDFDFVRWYLMHEFASVFVDETWYLLVHTPCKHLQSDNRCGIYETRPQICRDYSNKECEYENDYTYDVYFETPEQIEEYMQARFNSPADPEFRSRKPGLPIVHVHQD